MKVLVINSGSSSIKYQLFLMPEESVLAKGAVERIGEVAGTVTYESFQEDTSYRYEEEQAIPNHQQGLETINRLLLDEQHGVIRAPEEIAVVGHRVVHGGEQFSQATDIMPAVIEQIEQLIPLAPLHNPPNLTGIRIVQRVFPSAQQVAVFDTAFHQTLPDYVYRYPIPNRLYDQHRIRIYGMHGTSHQYVAQEAARYLSKPLESLNLITIHLGNGCSMTAIRQGQSVDTSMGLSPLAGLMMGTRSGDIDPAIPYFLSQEEGLSPEEIDKLLNKESGLMGIAGHNDLRTVVEQHKTGDALATLALRMYCYRIKRFIGAYLAVLGQVDALVFTAGVGENSAYVREQSCQGLTHLGITLDADKNQQSVRGARAIQADSSQVKVIVMPTNEELAIAQQVYQLTK